VGILRQKQSPTNYSWTDGTPTVTTTNTPTGVFAYGLNNGLQLTLPADTTDRTVKLYMGVWDAQGRLEISLSDGSAPTFVDTSLINQTNVSNAVYTINYHAGTNGQTLIIRWTVNASFNAFGNVTLQAASLVSSGPAPTPTPTPAAEFQISSSAPFAQLVTNIASDPNGNFVVAWQSLLQDGNGWGIFARRYDSAGLPQGNEFQVNTFTPGNQFVPRVAMDSLGNFAIVWESFQVDGSGYGVSCQRFNAAGVALGGEFQVNTNTTDNQHDPYIAMAPNGAFVVVWSSNLQDGSLDGIYGQRFDSAGAPVGAEFHVSTFTNNIQGQPTVSMDASGNFVVVWESQGQDGSGYGAYMQRYNSSGVAQGGEVRVNTVTANDQAEPYVNLASGGSFVIAWASTSQDGDGIGVYAKRYNASGVAQGSEFRVNTFTSGDQTNPSVATDSTGNFVIIWESQGQDGSGKGIYGQRYNSSGVAQGSEFLVNTFTSSDQAYPFVTRAPAGNFVVVWTSSGQDGSNEGVYGKRFNSSGVPLNTP